MTAIMDDPSSTDAGFARPAVSVESPTVGRGSLEGSDPIVSTTQAEGRLRSERATSVLVADDDADQLHALEDELHRAGLAVTTSPDSADALEKLRHSSPDVVVTELFMPKFHGLTICAAATARPTAPLVVVMSAHASTEDRISAFLAGATDFLCKPFENKELIARIAAHLRNAGRRKLPACTSFAGVSVDLQREAAIVHGKIVKLPTVQFHLLAFMLRNVGRVLSHQDLRVAAELAGDGAAQRLVQRLHKTLVKAGMHPSLITTVRGSGYCIGVETLTAPKPAA